MREHRLYQADWLIRFYGFEVPEIVAGGEDGLLDLAIDPKLAWALKHRAQFPGRRQPRRPRNAAARAGPGRRAASSASSRRGGITACGWTIWRGSAGSIDKVRPFIETVDWTPGGLTDDQPACGPSSTPQPEQLSLF